MTRRIRLAAFASLALSLSFVTASSPGAEGAVCNQRRRPNRLLWRQHYGAAGSILHSSKPTSSRAFRRKNVVFVHSGWGGDRVTGGGGGPIDHRLERDVFAYKPTVVTVSWGMNDGGYRGLQEAGYVRCLCEKATGTWLNRSRPNLPGRYAFTLIQASPYDE